MENASKALLMAGEVLISIIIISALLLMFNGVSSYQQVSKQNEKEAEVIQFNNNYEAYNRKDLRGNDVYTLINRIVDYNRRRSTEGKGEKDEGQYYAYTPITIKVSFKADNGKTETELTAPDKENNLIFKGLNNHSIEINATNNKFDDLFGQKNGIESEYGSGILLNLVNGYTSIFVEDFSEKTESQKKQIFYNFNSAMRYNSDKYKFG